MDRLDCFISLHCCFVSGFVLSREGSKALSTLGGGKWRGRMRAVEEIGNGVPGCGPRRGGGTYIGGENGKMGTRV